MQGLPAGSAGLIGRLATGGNPLSPDVLALPTAVGDAAIPLVFFDLEELASRRQAVGTVRYGRVDVFAGGVSRIIHRGWSIGWGFPDVSAVAAVAVGLWEHAHRQHVNVRLAAPRTHGRCIHATKVVAWKTAQCKWPSLFTVQAEPSPTCRVPWSSMSNPGI